jgi:tRNA 2-thiouridine synthesizing protein A
MNQTVVELDARRLLCPMPVIKLQDCLKKQAMGTRVEITSTDPGAMNDIPTWCRINGHDLISSSEDGMEYVFLVEKGTD